MEQAIQDSGLSPDEVSNIRTGIIMGSGGPSARTIVEAADMSVFPRLFLASADLTAGMSHKNPSTNDGGGGRAF